MLVLPDRVARLPPSSGLAAILEDSSWELVIHGSATIMAISSLAVHILQFPPIEAFAWATVGFISGFLVKKTICHHRFSRSITRAALTFNDRCSHARIIMLSISLLASFIFPVIANIIAVCVGAYAGYIYRHLPSGPTDH